ncbi:unnamed protein product, partial [Effrenium voratum]
VVEGWAIYDLLDDVTGAAFLAERYWWNAGPDGTWYDYSPFPENMEFMLLAEAFCPTGPREPEALTQQQQALAELLLRRRFPKARRAKLGLVTLKAPPLPEPKAAPELPEAEPAEDAPAPIPEPEAACASGEVAPEQPLTGQQPQSEQPEQPEPEQAEPAEQPEQREEREATPEPAPPEPAEEPLTAEAARQLARRCKE